MSNIIAQIKKILLPIAKKHNISLDEAIDILIGLLDSDVQYMIKEMKEAASSGKKNKQGSIAEIISSIAQEKNISITEAKDLLRSLLDSDIRDSILGDTSFKKTNN
jgi:type III secretion system FlhB-like substrate exporter